METRWIVLIACMSLPAALAVATLWIQWRNWRTRSWQQASGRIESSRVASREVRSRRVRTTGSGRNTGFITGEDFRTGNFAHVAYSFAVGSTTYRSDRVCLMGEPDGTLPAILKRYPKGKIVTVLYNPEDPNECILERDEPGKIRESWFGTAVLAALILGGFFVVTEGVDWLGTVLANPPRATAVVTLAGFALFIAMLSRVFTKHARAMKKWPTTEGRIVRSEITTTVQRHRRPNRADDTVTMYVPRIVYSYQADGHTFESDDIGWTTSSNRRSVAEKQVKRHPLNARVRVHYNPADPAQATLSPSMGMIPLVLWFFAAAMAFAAFAVGWLRSP